MPIMHTESPTNRFRLRRFALVKDLITRQLQEKQSCRIIDIGGEPAYWEIFGADLDWDRIQVLLVNLTVFETSHRGIVSIAGDARDLGQFGDLSFDIVHSNSVIEHVGRWPDMVMMAKEVRRLAPRYFVQTPYFWFPMEPHARTLFLHWMPESWRYRLLMKRTCGYWQKRPDVGSAVMAIQSASLLDKQQMKFLFPDAEIVSERILGITKSLMAVRNRI
jgi:hypothetical protein